MSKIKECRICESSKSDSIQMCDCGYDFEKKEIRNKDKILRHLAQFSRRDQWIENVRLIKRINEVQSKKRHSMKETAELIEKSTYFISTYCNLAYALDDNPKLLKCKNITNAMKLLKDIERGIEENSEEVEFEREKDLRDYMEKNWQTISLSKDWNLVKKEYDAEDIGNIDLLAKHKKEPKWLVIELKIEQSSDKAVGQLLRYMGWVKCNRADDNQKIEGLIISKAEENKILYALLYTRSIKLQLYSYNGKELNLMEIPPKRLLKLKEMEARVRAHWECC